MRGRCARLDGAVGDGDVAALSSDAAHIFGARGIVVAIGVGFAVITARYRCMAAAKGRAGVRGAGVAVIAGARTAAAAGTAASNRLMEAAAAAGIASVGRATI